MPLDPDLLSAAHSARARYIVLDQEAEQARAAMGEAVRNLHANGGSLREIADALEMSHQRVHQIVGAARRARGRDASDLVECSFCAKTAKQAKKIVAGPGVYICDECVGRFESTPAAVAPDDECSFCRKRASQVEHLAAGPMATICNLCIALCRDIIAEDVPTR